MSVAQRSGSSPAGNAPGGAGVFTLRFLVALFFLGGLNVLAWWALRPGESRTSAAFRVAGAALTEDARAIRVAFDRDVVPEAPGERPDPSRWLRLEPDLPGATRWESSRSLLYEPRAPFPGSEKVIVVVEPSPPGSGRRFEGLTRFEIVTPPLRLLGVAQARFLQERGVSERRDTRYNIVLRATFSGPVDPGRAVAHLSVNEGPGGSAAPFRIATRERAQELELEVASGASKLEVAWGPAIPGAEAPLVVTERQTAQVEITRALRVTSVQGTNAALENPSVDIYFTNPLVDTAPEQLKRFFLVEPPVSFDVSVSWSRAQLVGDFRPGAHYRVTVKAGLQGAAGAVLAADTTHDIFLKDRSPTIRFASSGTFLSSEGNLSLVLKTVNVRTVSLRASSVHANDLVHALELGWARSHFMRELPPRVYHTVPARNQPTDLVVDLRDLVGPDARGVWFVEATSGPGESEVASGGHQLVSVSDLGLTVKDCGKNGNMAWVVSLRTGEPLAGVSVGLRSLTNQLLAEGVTGVDGIVRFGELSSADGPPRLATARRETDLAYLELSERELSRVDFDVGGRPFLAGGSEAFLFLDRGVYRPGETAHLRGLVRNAGGALPASFPLVVETLRPDGKRYRAETVRLDPEGAFDTVLPITPSAHTGLYVVEVRLPGDKPGVTLPRLGSGTFRVEEYLPARLKVELSATGGAGAQPSGRQRWKPGETVQAQIRASHLFGLPAEGCIVDASWSLVPAPFLPPDWRSYRFGVGEGPVSVPRVAARSLTLDASGEGNLVVAIPEVEGSTPHHLKLSARVTDLGGRPVEESMTLPVDPAPHYLGLRAVNADGAIPAGMGLRFECVAVLPDGELARLDAAELVVHAVTWSTVQKRQADGSYELVSREDLREHSRQRVLLSGGRGAFELSDLGSGSYRLRLRDPASTAAAELSLYVDGPWAVASSGKSSTPDRLKITFERPVRPGEEAVVSIQSPFQGSLLLTLETDRVLWTQVMKLESHAVKARIPLGPDLTGAPFLTASVVRPVEPDAPWLSHRAHGVERIPLDLSSRRLTVTLEAPHEARPESSCAVRATVTSEQGEVVPGASVLLALVDEGILSLTREKLPDPFDFFYGRRAHGVVTADTYTSLIEEVPLLRGRARPGGDSSESAGDMERRLSPIRGRRVQPTVLWLGPFTTGDDGVVIAPVEVPRFTGELRISAVASRGTLFGSSRRGLTVRGQFFFEQSFPRFLAPGDQFHVPVSLFNLTPRSGAASLEWTLDRLDLATALPAPGENLAFAALPAQHFDLPAFGGARASFRLSTAAAVGLASARLDAQFEGLRHSERLELPVRPPSPRTTTWRTGRVTADEPVRIEGSEALLAGTRRYRLVISELPELELAPALEYLLTYPHGCIEQTVSRAFPLLHLGALAEKLGLVAGDGPRVRGSERLESARGIIDGSIARILDLQSHGGWFGTYSGADSPNAWGTVYATHFLLEAQAAGHEVPEEGLAAALRYVEDAIVRPWPPRDLLLAAYGSQVLAISGKGDPGHWIGRLRDLALKQIGSARAAGPDAEAQNVSLELSVRGLLASTYVRLGDPRTAAALLSGQIASVPAQVSESGGLLRSPARETAILLSALVDVSPDDARIPELLDRLRTSARVGRWGTTQENAFALFALGKLARRASARGGWQAVVKRGDELLAEIAPGQSWRVEGSDLEGPIEILATGSGGPSFWWTEEGIPTTGKVSEVDAGIVVRRTLLDRTFTPVDTAHVKAGADLVVRWEIEALEPLENVALTDLLPAGLEVENPALGGAAPPELKGSLLSPEGVSLRDDRVVAYFDLSSQKRGTFLYAVRAVTRGDFALPPISAEAMYRPSVRSVSGAGRLVIE